MTAAEFCHIQASLGLNNKELAKKLRRDPAAVSRWRKGEREIPENVAKLLAEFILEAEFKLTLADLLGIARVAQRQGISIGTYILRSLRRDLCDTKD